MQGIIYALTFTPLLFFEVQKFGGIGSHDKIAFFGDLNYRIDLPRDVCVAHIADGSYDALREVDQLLCQRFAHGTPFFGFNEAPLRFPPTYKYDLFSSQYDSSEKRRCPAWTDRILFRGMTADNYYSDNSLIISDHRPVAALLVISIDKLNGSRIDQLSSSTANKIPTVQARPHLTEDNVFPKSDTHYQYCNVSYSDPILEPVVPTRPRPKVAYVSPRRPAVPEVLISSSLSSIGVMTGAASIDGSKNEDVQSGVEYGDGFEAGAEAQVNVDVPSTLDRDLFLNQ